MVRNRRCSLPIVEVVSRTAYALFSLADAFDLKPVDGEYLALDPKAEGAQKLSAALVAWRGALDELEAGEMTQDEYERWRATFE